MKPKSSPLVLIDFAILNVKYRFITPAPTDKLDAIRKIMSEYDVDIDFNITESNNLYNIFAKVEINKESKVGHSMFAEGIGVFNIPTKDSLKKEEISNYLNTSGVPMVINNLRAFIGNLTSTAPYGRYLFPTLDLGDLLTSKYGVPQNNMSTPAK